MNLMRTDEGWQLEFNPNEAEVMAACLSELANHYRVSPEKLPDSLQKYWRGKISGKKSGDKALADEQENLHMERESWRPQRLDEIELWLESYPESGEEPWIINFGSGQFDDFLAILNDRRLLLAAEFDVTESDMEIDPAYIRDEIKARALWEIHMLAYVQEYCLEINRST